MTSPNEQLSIKDYPVSSTPFRPKDNQNANGSTGTRRSKLGPLAIVSRSEPESVTKLKSLRHSIGHITLRAMTPRQIVWNSQRTSMLFELLTRPALLFSPSMGIRLPFYQSPRGSPGRQSVRLAMKERNRPIDPDPCLLSIDGLLDCLFATSSLVDQVYYDCCNSSNNVDEGDDYDKSPTVVAANFFRRRVKPALSRLLDLRLKLSDFKLGECIGRGACGIVRVVREIAPPCSVYAMKSQYKGAWLHHDPEGSQIMLERTVLAQAAAIENPWLPHLHYAFQDEKQLHLVMDYEPGGDLYIFLSKVGHLLDPEIIQFYAAEAIEAIHSLHQMGYIHCDLKPENFAIERSGHLKLLDFGSAIRLDADGKCVCPTMVGTKEYLNIELLRQRGRRNEDPLLVGPEYDYWAIGVLLYELFYGQTPFYDEDDDTMMQNIVDYKKTLKFPGGVDIPEEAVQLIRSLITTPSKRLTYHGLVRHSFFTNIDFATLRQTTPPYIPTVGKMNDVSNFSGGGSRTRDETILDVSTNQTFSPVRMKKSCPSAVCRPNSDCEQVSNTCEVDDMAETVLRNSSFVPDVPSETKDNVENIDPLNPSENVSAKPTGLTSREIKEKAIREAAAVPVHEDIEEIEDIDWQGSDCVRNLPFVGYTFTPGLVLLRQPTGAQTAAAVAAGLGTSIINPSGTPFRPNIPGTTKKSSSVLKTNRSYGASNCIVKQSNIAENSEDAVKMAELQKHNEQLEKQITDLHSQMEEQAEDFRKQLSKALETIPAISQLHEEIIPLITSLKENKPAISQLTKCITRLQQENKAMHESLKDSRLQCSVLEKVQSVMMMLSRLKAELESVQMQVRTVEREQADRDEREQELRNQLADSKNQLDAARHENTVLCDRYEKLKEAAATMETCLINQPVSNQNSEMDALRRHLAETKLGLTEECNHLKAQLERLRVSNTQLMSQRDEARQEMREANAALLRERELKEVAQQSSECEVFRLTTITQQQGKLIDHMCSLLPPEHRFMKSVPSGKHDMIHVQSVLDQRRSCTKLPGHGTMKNGGRSTTKLTINENVHGPGGPLIAAASAFFGRRRAAPQSTAFVPDDPNNSSSQKGSTFPKQPSRLRKIVSKSRLRLKRRTVFSRGNHAAYPSECAIQSDTAFTEDEGTIGCYSPGSADEFDSGLPIQVPVLPSHALDSADCTSNTGSTSSVPSTASSAPPVQPPYAGPRSSWRRMRSKRHVGWAASEVTQASTDYHMVKGKSHTKLLKQLSKVLTKAKPVPTHSEDGVPFR
ncbi:unnamed protein product [Calicophoron daubneyi]|uniref:non-specific serine/threonine protein kinase n=1 Tax=Calicophoron daubneyi TaxID=300641 RepID=A0AAV2TW67_CALDB